MAWRIESARHCDFQTYTRPDGGGQRTLGRHVCTNAGPAEFLWREPFVAKPATLPAEPPQFQVVGGRYLACIMNLALMIPFYTSLYRTVLSSESPVHTLYVCIVCLPVFRRWRLLRRKAALRAGAKRTAKTSRVILHSSSRLSVAAPESSKRTHRSLGNMDRLELPPPTWLLVPSLTRKISARRREKICFISSRE